MERIGTLATRSAREVGRSNWTIGCEVLDRDFANFWEYCHLVEPLGIKTIRLQAGWAKCEPKQPERKLLKKDVDTSSEKYDGTWFQPCQIMLVGDIVR